MAANAAAAQSILNGLRSIAQVAPLPQPVIILAILETVVQVRGTSVSVSSRTNVLTPFPPRLSAYVNWTSS
jgi:hypothetical protein